MQSAIIKGEKILGVEPVFRGTRVPFEVLTDYLEGRDTVDQFLEHYPSVTRELAIAARPKAKCWMQYKMEKRKCRPRVS
jgi:uncharacterized protein (DUF433 family)